MAVGFKYNFHMKGEDRIVVQKLKKITVISMVFMTVELAGGYYADSIAIFADAFHLLSDVLAYVISLMAVLMSYRPSAPHLTFGYQKLQPLGALLNVAIIWFVTAQLFVQATHRMLHKSVVQEPLYMLLTSIFGLLCNLYIMQILHSDEHAGGHHNCSHSHHQHQPAAKKKAGSHEHLSHEGCSGHSLEEKIEKPHSQCKGHNHDHQQHNHEHQQHSHDHSQHNHDHHQHNHDHHQHNHDHHEHKQPCSHDHQAHTEHAHSHDGPCAHDHPIHKSSQHLCDKESSRSMAAVLRHSDDGISSDEQMKVSSNNFHNNINIEAAYIHIITDIILSIGVIISAGIIYFFAPEGHIWSSWQLADPLCTYLFSVMAIYSTIPIIKQSLMLLLDAGDPAVLSQINEDLKSNPQVVSVQCLKLWSSNRGKNYGGLRVKVRHGGRSSVQGVFSRHKVEGFVQCHEQNEQLMEKQ